MVQSECEIYVKHIMLEIKIVHSYSNCEYTLSSSK